MNVRKLICLSVACFCLPAFGQVSIKDSIKRQLGGALEQRDQQNQQQDQPQPQQPAPKKQATTRSEAANKAKITAGWQDFPAEDNTRVRLYVAHPDLKYAGEVPNLPALIVVQEWWGVNDDIQARTRDFAQKGYFAVAVDLYDGTSTADPKTAATLKTNLTTEAAQLRLKTGLDFLLTQVDRGIVNADKVGAIGWCMGGTQALNLAIADKRVKALAVFYGGDIVTDTEKLKNLQGPILGVFGNDDKNPSPEQVNAWEKSLKDAEKNVTVYRFDGAGHAFASESAKAMGTYKPTQAADAWAKTWAWLEKNLK